MRGSGSSSEAGRQEARKAARKIGSEEGRRPSDVKEKKNLHRPRVTALIAERK